ncbi:MAG: hypothetical protein J6J26_07345 [Bacteroides sp.]|nr:hypothetical protein [Bacteroides sp.]
MNKDNKDMEKVLLEDERISHFLQGLMNASEEATFLEELKGNIKLRQRASAQARLIKGMKQADEELLNAFKRSKESDFKEITMRINPERHKASAAIGGWSRASILDEDEGETCSSTRIPIKFVLRRYAAVAVVFLIVFVGYFSYDYYDTTSLGKEYANTFPVSSIVRGEANENVETELIALFEKVTNVEDLDQTISSLIALWQIAKQDTYNEYTDYAPYIGWYLAIAYLEDYEKDRAMDILKEMEGMYPEGTAIGNKVREILNK